jgi:uncharacterized protein
VTPAAFRPLRNALRVRVRAILGEGPECHGWDHTERVWRTARQLARREHADLAVVECAALLHDIGRADEIRARGGRCHATAGAKAAPALLRELGVTDAPFIRHVAACVRSHRYRRRQGGPPATLEARIVYDADKLDSMGAIGIGRAFHFAGGIGARVHNTRREALGAPSYSREDSAYREYLVKLRHLPQAVLTPSARRLAHARHTFMAAFFRRLQAEVRGVEIHA